MSKRDDDMRATEARLVSMLAKALAKVLRPGLLTRTEAMAYLGLRPQSFRRHARNVLPVVQVGTRTLYDRRDLDTWADARKVVGAPEPRRGRHAGPKAA